MKTIIAAIVVFAATVFAIGETRADCDILTDPDCEVARAWLAFTYQIKSGDWLGCGPKRCTIRQAEGEWRGKGWPSESEVLDAVSYTSDRPWRFRGDYGKCKVYVGSPKGRYDNANWNPVYVVAEAKHVCTELCGTLESHPEGPFECPR